MIALTQLGRPLRVLRLSLTARCNLSCPYCCPANDEPVDRLDLPDQLALIRACCSLGVRSLRLTGGEPLLSDQLESLLEHVAVGRSDPDDPLYQLEEVAITSNGVLLDAQRVKRLRQIGLDRITISLDAVQGDRVAAMAGIVGGASAGDRLLKRVLTGIDCAIKAGFDPSCGAIKINSVIQKGVNDDQLIPLARLARCLGIELRFIEYMDVGNRNCWNREHVMPAKKMIECLQREWPLEPLGRNLGGTAHRWRYLDRRAVVGVIASITEPFCGDCNRLRITVDGMAYTCLFGTLGTNLRPWLRPEVSSEDLIKAVSAMWRSRHDRYSEERGHTLSEQTRAEMAYLGG